ncbi:MAG: hypothetical protein AB2A00_40910 [Myxococcota bacterium]
MQQLIKILGRPRGSVLLFAVVGTLLTGGYAYAAATGWDWNSHHGTLAPEVRTSHHGYRSYSYWHDSHHWHGPTFFFWSSPYRGYRWGK